MTTPLHVSIVAAVISGVLLLVVFQLIRRRHLQPRYALLWLLTGSVMLVLALWRDLLGLVAKGMGIAYPPSALFVLGSLFILVLLLHFSAVISRLCEQNKRLAQRVALLQARVEDGERPRPVDASRESA
jgi:hypothetical protein